MQCRICSNTENNTNYQISEMMFGLGETFSYFQCDRCKCLQIAEIPPDMSRYYPPDYYSLSPVPVKRYRNPLRRYWKRIKDHYSVFPDALGGNVFNSLYPESRFKLLSKIRLNKESRILDVGCGAGSYLYGLREVGFQNLSGIDPYLDHDIQYENGLHIRKNSLHDLRGEYDVIMYHHSFEHIPLPVEELRIVSGLLSPDGVCMIRIPVVSSYAWEHYRENWIQIDAPRHYYLHSIKSMKLLAHQAGLRIKEIVYDSTGFQFEGSELYLRGIPFISDGANNLFPKSVRSLWKRNAQKLNAQHRGDQAAFYLTKSLTIAGHPNDQFRLTDREKTRIPPGNLNTPCFVVNTTIPVKAVPEESNKALSTCCAKYFEYTRCEILPLLPDVVSKALDIGCGSGNTLVWLKKIKSCSWIGGVDISEEAIRAAEKKLDIVYSLNVEKADLPIKESSLDVILCLDVLEHMVDPWNVLSRLQKLLKPGGALITSIPNVRNLTALFPLFFKGKWDYANEGILDKTHLRFFVRETAIQLVESSGLHVDMVETTGLGRSWKSKIINRMLPEFITSLFVKQYLIRGIRKNSHSE